MGRGLRLEPLAQDFGVSSVECSGRRLSRTIEEGGSYFYGGFNKNFSKVISTSSLIALSICPIIQS
jgi:hypothetical protein